MQYLRETNIRKVNISFFAIVHGRRKRKFIVFNGVSVNLTTMCQTFVVYRICIKSFKYNTSLKVIPVVHVIR